MPKFASAPKRRRLFAKVAHPKADFLPRIRCWPEQKELIALRASDRGQTYAEFALDAMLGKPGRSPRAAKIINDMRELIAAVKALAARSADPSVVADSRKALAAIIDAMERVGQGREGP